MNKLSSAFVALAISAFPFVASAFSDVSEGDYHYDAINFVYEKGMVQGYEDGTFKPDNLINRAEFVKILVSSKYQGPLDGSNCFTDINHEWYAGFVCWAQQYNIVSGYPDGTFGPAKMINLAEGLKIVLESYKFNMGTATDPWYKKYYDYAKENDYLDKIEANIGDYITRGEMAQLLYNIDYAPPL